MAKSLLSWIEKIRNGFQFHETFESDNFREQQSWILVQGVPISSASQAINGIRSLGLAGSQDSLGQPIILRKEIDIDVNVENQVAVVWFYDDLNAVLQGGFFKVKIDNGDFLQVGTRNGISTGFYVCGSGLEDTFGTTTAIARTLGWHEFKIVRDLTSGFFKIFIDNFLVLTSAISTTTNYVDRIYLQGSLAGAVTDSFGNFDEMRLLRDNAMTFHGVAGRRVEAKILDETATFSVSNNLATDSFSNSNLAVNFTDTFYWLQVSQKIASATDISNYSKLSCRLGKIEMVGGDVFKFNEFDFAGRKVTSITQGGQTLASRNLSTIGVTETISFSRQDDIAFAISSIEGEDKYQIANNFYETARRGIYFSLATDSDFTGMAIANATAYAGQSVMTVYVNIGLQVGEKVILFDQQHSKYYSLSIASILGPTITFNEKLPFDVLRHDIIRSLRFYPYLELDGLDLGITLSNPRQLRFDWSQTCRDVVFS
jgi:hypothetical protein